MSKILYADVATMTTMAIRDGKPAWEKFVAGLTVNNTPYAAAYDGEKKWKYLKRVARIVQMLNHPTIKLSDLLQHAEWLSDHKMGRFTVAAQDVINWAPTLIGMYASSKFFNQNIHVALEFQLPMWVYLDYIFTTKELPHFIFPHENICRMNNCFSTMLLNTLPTEAKTKNEKTKAKV